MVEVLLSSPLLTLSLVITLGAALGVVPFGPLRFGPAGALFVGLAVGALDPGLGEGLELVQSLGLALFVYTIGLSAGATFFGDLRRQYPLMIIATVLLLLFGGLIILAEHFLDLEHGIGGGIFAGVLTATPALAAASDALGGSSTPAVGYAIAYPVGVILTMVMLTYVTRTSSPGHRDPDPVSASGLVDFSVLVHRDVAIAEIPGVASPTGDDGETGGTGGTVRVSYLLHKGEVTVASPTGRLVEGDQVVLVGVPEAVEEAAEFLGERIDRHLAHDRSVVDFRRFTVSSRSAAGRSIGELGLHDRFGALVTRIRRGDDDFLAQRESILQLGDRLRIVYPRERVEEISSAVGDSENEVTQVNFLPVGLGLALGVAAGLISVPVGGASVALGAAAGPLVVGLILGRMERTGPLVWKMPTAANLIIRQLGLIVFLAAVGLSSGQAFTQTAFTMTGVLVLLTAAATLLLILPMLWLSARGLGLSTARTAGAMAGFVGQPVLIAHVNSQLADSRAGSGYSAVFALGMIVKIVVVQAVVAL